MKTSDLLLTSLSITEDEYNYYGSFFLNHGNISIKVELSDLQYDKSVTEIKNVFKLEENLDVIRKTLMDLVMEKASISSKITEGENYEAKAENSFDGKVIDINKCWSS